MRAQWLAHTARSESFAGTHPEAQGRRGARARTLARVRS